MVIMVVAFDFTSVLKSELSLHEACRTNSIERVRKLVGDKVDVNARNQVGERVHTYRPINRITCDSKLTWILFVDHHFATHQSLLLKCDFSLLLYFFDIVFSLFACILVWLYYYLHLLLIIFLVMLLFSCLLNFVMVIFTCVIVSVLLCTHIVLLEINYL